MSVPLTVVLATHNAHKALEIRAIFENEGIEFLTLDQFPGAPDVAEDKPTLEGNAEKKACNIAQFTKQVVLADDTGLEVAFLNGAPGVFSARFAGPQCSFEDNNRKLLKLLKDVPKKHRKARFRSVMCVAVPGGAARQAEGVLDGFIADEARGSAGFGYDPVFLVPGLGKTLAELSPAEKNRVSHRFRALQAIRPVLVQLKKDIQKGWSKTDRVGL